MGESHAVWWRESQRRTQACHVIRRIKPLWASTDAVRSQYIPDLWSCLPGYLNEALAPLQSAVTIHHGRPAVSVAGWCPETKMASRLCRNCGRDLKPSCNCRSDLSCGFFSFSVTVFISCPVTVVFWRTWRIYISLTSYVFLLFMEYFETRINLVTPTPIIDSQHEDKKVIISFSADFPEYCFVYQADNESGWAEDKRSMTCSLLSTMSYSRRIARGGFQSIEFLRPVRNITQLLVLCRFCFVVLLGVR